MPKYPCKKCATCTYRGQPLAMNRIYIKDGEKLKPIGWLCKKCGKHTIDPL